jgi:hypothetical protein
VSNVFDSVFNDMPGVAMYRSWVFPDAAPDAAPEALLANWSWDDLVSYVGGEYAKAAYADSLG